MEYKQQSSENNGFDEYDIKKNDFEGD